MTSDWNPKVHTPTKIHAEGWALIIAVISILALGGYALVSIFA